MNSKKRSLEPSGALHKGTKKKKQEPGPRVCGINARYASDPFLSELSQAWRDTVALKDAHTSAELLNTPFQCCCLPNFVSTVIPGSGTGSDERLGTEFQEGDFLHKLVSELLKLKFYEKNNDLYQFRQSDDLKKFKTPHVSALRALFRSECLPWLRKITGLDLTDTIDMTCSKYDYTDLLLCHDDELEGRRIAFILYLTSDWSPEDGGSLDLFDTDAAGQPRAVVRSLVPVWNNMVFFEVNAKSFHQVSEVFSSSKTRLSINGWFHGPPTQRPPPHKPHPLPLSPPASLGLEVLSDWVNPVYLDVGVQQQIQQQFEEDSQIEIPNFLLEEKYQLLCEEMASAVTKSKWTPQGPANRKHTHVAAPSSLPPLSRAFLELLLSLPFCLLLAHMTDLELVDGAIKPSHAHPNGSHAHTSSLNGSHAHTSSLNGSSTQVAESAPPDADSAVSVPALRSSAQCRGEVCHWRPGNYTLAGDPRDPGFGRFSLEASISFNSEGWCEEYGGTVSYIASEEDEEFLTVCPSPNSLSLVYKDKDLLHFTKYVNHRSQALTHGDSSSALTHEDSSSLIQGNSSSSLTHGDPGSTLTHGFFTANATYIEPLTQ